MKDILETGGNLTELEQFAKTWFEENNVPIPEGAKAWSKARVKLGEIPPGTTTGTLTRNGINVSDFIAKITSTTSKKIEYAPISQDNIYDTLGLVWLGYTWVNKHKKVTTKCSKCNIEEVLDYGTLQRMKASGTRFCRYCRNAGGKLKLLDRYNVFSGFEPIGRSEDGRVLYKCLKCSSNIERTLAHVNTAEYLVCEKCNPRENFGARLHTEYGYFDSKVEYEAYTVLLKYFSSNDIVRQKKYDELFHTGTNHTADFYILPIDLVLEVTTKSNNIGIKYKETATWKMSLSSNVIFAYSLQEVEDIVRPLLKDIGLTVSNRRNVLCRSTKCR